jgi:pilus assembly protein Flp/PilA
MHQPQIYLPLTRTTYRRDCPLREASACTSTLKHQMKHQFEYPGVSKVMTKLSSFMRDDAGVTAIEYGLIAAGIGVAIVYVVQEVGVSLEALFTSVKNNL